MLMTHDYSGLLERIENLEKYNDSLCETCESNEGTQENCPDHYDLKEALRKNHHGQDCIVCFEKECICKPLRR